MNRSEEVAGSGDRPTPLHPPPFLFPPPFPSSLSIHSPPPFLSPPIRAALRPGASQKIKTEKKTPPCTAQSVRRAAEGEVYFSSFFFPPLPPSPLTRDLPFPPPTAATKALCQAAKGDCVLWSSSSLFLHFPPLFPSLYLVSSPPSPPPPPPTGEAPTFRRLRQLR